MTIKSYYFSTNQYKSEARMPSSGKKMLIPCLEDKYDERDNTPTGIPIDNMSLVSSNEHETESNISFLSQKSVEAISELMEQLSKV